MVDNDFNYIAIEVDQGIDIEALGYFTGSVSTDGKIMVIDKEDGTQASDIGYTPQSAAPSYAAALAPNYPDMTHAEAKAFTQSKASSVGASDGFSRPR